MKKFIRLFAMVVSLSLCLSLLLACTDSLDAAPKSVSSLYASGEAVELNESYFRMNQSFRPAEKTNGYISYVDLKVDVAGYDADFTYFDAAVTVHWTYVAITDDFPTGRQEEQSTTIRLKANGDGSYEQRVCLDGVRGIANVEVFYEWVGTATRL